MSRSNREPTQSERSNSSSLRTSHSRSSTMQAFKIVTRYDKMEVGISQNRGRPKLSNSGLILKVSGTPFFDVLNHTVSVETHRKMKAVKNTSCATVVQQITSEDATVTHAFHVLKGWNDFYYLLFRAPRPAPREHHQQHQVNLPRQVGQVLVFRCGKEEDPAMLSDYAMPIHIFKGSICE